MTLSEFSDAVAALGGARPGLAGHDWRHDADGTRVARWTAWIGFPTGPGVMVDAATPEEALSQLRERLAGGLAAPGTERAA